MSVILELTHCCYVTAPPQEVAASFAEEADGGRRGSKRGERLHSRTLPVSFKSRGSDSFTLSLYKYLLELYFSTQWIHHFVFILSLNYRESRSRPLGLYLGKNFL